MLNYKLNNKNHQQKFPQSVPYKECTFLHSQVWWYKNSLFVHWLKAAAQAKITFMIIDDYNVQEQEWSNEGIRNNKFKGLVE